MPCRGRCGCRVHVFEAVPAPSAGRRGQLDAHQNTMKPADRLALTACLCLAIASGCQNPANALKTTGVAFSTVDAAMTGWAAYTQRGGGTDAQILTVSNAYTLVYNSGLVMSNAWVVYAENTNASIPQLAASTFFASQTNLVNIVNQFTK